MTYEEIVETVKERLKDVDTSKVDGLLAIQINILGEGEGAYIYTFDDDDVINLIHPILYTDGTTEYVKIVQEDILASNLKLNYQNIDYSKVDIVSFIKVEDIYGNTYETEPKFYE